MSLEPKLSGVGAGGATEATLLAILANQTNDAQTVQLRDSGGNELGSVGHPMIVSGTSAVPIEDLEILGVFDDTGGVAYTDVLSQAQTSTQLVDATEVEQTTAPTDTSHPDASAYSYFAFEVQGSLVGATAVKVRMYVKMYADSQPANVYHASLTGGSIGLVTQIDASEFTGRSHVFESSNAQMAAKTWITLEAVGTATPGTSLVVRAKKVP